MRRRTNIQHGRARRRLPGLLVPGAIILVCYPVLLWLVIELVKAVAR